MAWYAGKVVLITGASSGIGAAMVRELAGAGARIVAAARSAQALQALASELQLGPERLVPAPVDVRSQAEVQRAADAALAAFGCIDVAVANAGIEYLGPAQMLSDEELQIMFETNFLGYVHLVRAVLPAMRRQGAGTIAYISSPMARLGFAWSAGYAASKAAADAFALGLRHELAGEPIRVVTAYPGGTETRTAKHLPPERIPAWHSGSRKAPAAETARRLLAAMAGGSLTPVVSGQIGLLLALQRWMPGLAERLITRVGAAGSRTVS